MKNFILFFLAFTIAASLTGCGQRRPDFFFIVDDIRGAKPKTEVVWRGATVGHVSRIQFQHGRFRVEVALKPEYRNEIHSDATIKIANGISTGFKPIVKIEGGHNAAVPMIKPGDQLAESRSFIDSGSVKRWLSSTMPEVQRHLGEMMSNANSADVQKVWESLKTELENARSAVQRGEATIDQIKQRVSNAVEAAIKEFNREENEHPQIEKQEDRETSRR